MDAEAIADLNPAKVLRQRFELENSLSSSRSPLGGHLEAAENGIIGPGHSGAGRDVDERKRLKLLDLLTYCGGLTRQEVDTARLYYDKLLDLQPYERNIRIADMCDGDGEEIVAVRITGPDGKPLAGFVRVRGVRLRFPTYEAVADHMAAGGDKTADGGPMTLAAVKRRLCDARSKIAEALNWRSFMASQEEATL